MLRLYRAEVTVTHVVYFVSDGHRIPERMAQDAADEARRDGSLYSEEITADTVSADHQPSDGWDKDCLVYGDTGGRDMKLGEALEKYTGSPKEPEKTTTPASDPE